MQNADEAWGDWNEESETPHRLGFLLRRAVEASVREVAMEVFLHGVAKIEAAKPSDNPPAVAPVSGEPGGVRVVWTEEASIAATAQLNAGRGAGLAIKATLPHLRLEVDRETLESALTARNKGWVNVQGFATRLGLTLSDGGTDG